MRPDLNKCLGNGILGLIVMFFGSTDMSGSDANIVSIGTFWSTIWFTKDDVAPFSSNRLTK